MSHWAIWGRDSNCCLFPPYGVKYFTEDPVNASNLQQEGVPVKVSMKKGENSKFALFRQTPATFTSFSIK